ncbi:unnamed protein product, partial [Brassica rapa subsp. narinosa]
MSKAKRGTPEHSPEGGSYWLQRRRLATAPGHYRRRTP